LTQPSRPKSTAPGQVTVDSGASYATAAAQPAASADDVAVISEQLGRPARGEPAVMHRCSFGLPTVVRVAPRLDDGTPFPTTFWLSCPLLRSRVGTLEADHVMVGFNERLGTDEILRDGYAAAHERYVTFRDTLGTPLHGAPGSGGMPGYVKCLHVHVGHFLATGDNPVGAETFAMLEPVTCPTPCVTTDAVDA
jgi:uncharacterized protein